MCLYLHTPGSPCTPERTTVNLQLVVLGVGKAGDLLQKVQNSPSRPVVKVFTVGMKHNTETCLPTDILERYIRSILHSPLETEPPEEPHPAQHLTQHSINPG